MKSSKQNWLIKALAGVIVWELLIIAYSYMQSKTISMNEIGILAIYMITLIGIVFIVTNKQVHLRDDKKSKRWVDYFIVIFMILTGEISLIACNFIKDNTYASYQIFIGFTVLMGAIVLGFKWLINKYFIKHNK